MAAVLAPLLLLVGTHSRSCFPAPGGSQMRGRSQGGCEVLSPLRCAMRPHAQTHSACVNARQPQTCDLGSWRRGGPPIEHHRRSRILATSRDHRSNHCSTACSMCVVAARPVRPVRLVKSQLCDVYYCACFASLWGAIRTGRPFLESAEKKA